MAITMQVGENERGTEGTFSLDSHQGCEAGRVDHAKDCPHHGKYDRSGTLSPDCITSGFRRCGVYKGLVMKTTHVGLVLSTGEHNWHDDSDFYAIVWDNATGSPVEVTYASTRGWTYANGARVDATPEIQAKADAWYAARRAERLAAEIAQEASTPRKGKTLQVVKGRKVPVGTTGECIWVGDGQWGTRVGIQDTAGNVHWTAVTNVVVA